MSLTSRSIDFYSLKWGKTRRDKLKTYHVEREQPIEMNRQEHKKMHLSFMFHYDRDIITADRCHGIMHMMTSGRTPVEYVYV